MSAYETAINETSDLTVLREECIRQRNARLEWVNEAERLRDLLRDARDELQELSGSNSSYCEMCDRHAPKSEDGDLDGTVPHADDCIIRRMSDAIWRLT